MANIPFRGMAAAGILRDPNPYELNLNAWSNGANVRFHANYAERAPIWRAPTGGALTEEPVFCAGFEPASGYDTVNIASVTGRLYRYQGGNLNEVSAFGVGSTAITNGGTGYASGSPPTVTFSAPSVSNTTPPGLNPRAAVGVATVNGSGVVTAITITDPGFYPFGSTVPTVTVAPPGTGTTATATAAFEFTPSSQPQAVTMTMLGGVAYYNRQTSAPQYLGSSSDEFHVMPNMDSAWTCAALRAWGDYLVALNVTKPANWRDPYTQIETTGGPLPNMVKMSTPAFYGQPPASWDAEDPNYSAVENTLDDAHTPIVDGAPLRDAFVVYTQDEVYIMSLTGTEQIVAIDRAFSDGGLMNQNCVVEVQGIHYCFGPYDIYRHDGLQKVSIVDGLNRQTIFRNLTVKKANVCFVAYIRNLNQVWFCYNTGDSNAYFKNCDLCNQAAVYDIKSGTWSFVDLPNVGAMTMANMDPVVDWATDPGVNTWFSAGGSWYDQQNSYVKYPVGVSGIGTSGLALNQLVAYDFMNKGGLHFPYVAAINAPAFLEKTGIDLDQVGSDLVTYKLVNRMYPLVDMFGGSPVQIQVGGALLPASAAVYSQQLSFDPTQQYHVDTRVGGRYVAVKFTVNAPADFQVTGFDLEVMPNGSR